MKRLLHQLDLHLEEYLLMLLLALMAFVMLVQVFCRYALGISLSWSEELTRYFFIWCGFLSISFCCAKGISIRTGLLLEVLGAKAAFFLRMFGLGAAFLFFLYLLPFAASYVQSAVTSGQVSPACGIPMVFIQAAPLLGFLLMLFRLGERMIREIRRFRGIYEASRPADPSADKADKNERKEDL